jgi:PAS domain S-box-containing protein
MRNIIHSRLMKRYLLITLFVLLFALSSIYWITMEVLKSSVQEQIDYRDELIAKNIGKRIDFLMEKIKNDMRIASNYVLKGTEVDKRFYRAEIERMVAYDPLYLFVHLYDEKGELLQGIPYPFHENSLFITDIVNRLSWSQAYYISPLRILPDGTQSIAISFPAVNERGEFKGGATAFISLNTLSEYLLDLQIGEQGANAVLDRNGVIIAHSDKEYIGTSLRTHIVSDFLNKRRYGLWSGEILEEKMILVYLPLRMAEMGLLVGESVQQAIEPTHKVMKLLARSFLIVLFITIALTLIGTSRVSKPIFELIQQAKDYKVNKRRKFDIVRTDDEIEELSWIMNEMATELIDKERRLFYILQSIPYGVITTDKDGLITTFNKGAEVLTLFSRDEVVGKYIFDLPIKEKKEEFISWKTLTEGKAFDEIESYIVDKQKNRHVVKVYSSLFKGEENQLVGAILILRDVSDMKKLEMFAKQSERLAALGQLTAGVAHEIKNPLSIIQAAAEAIDLEIKDLIVDSPLLHELNQDILESIDRMNDLLTDFLKMSKGEEEQQRETINVVTILEELLHLLRKTCNDLEIKVYRQYETKHAFVKGNKNQLTQVFLNIILNSIHAMDSNGELSVLVNSTGVDWEIEIRDTGKGIPAAKLQWIFTPFYSTKKEGTGLGLSIAHELIVNHDGKIWASSIEGKETTMHILLPKGMKEDHSL